MSSVKVMFTDTGRIETVEVKHWTIRSAGRPMEGPAPTIKEPDWFRTLPGYRVEGVLERGFDYVATKR